MSGFTHEKLVETQKLEAKRIAEGKKSFEDAAAWVEKNVPESERCKSCGGVGLAELDAGRYASCKACAGKGKKK